MDTHTHTKILTRIHKHNTHTHTKTHTWIVHICSHRYSRISHETLNVAGDDVASDLKQWILLFLCPLGTYRESAYHDPGVPGEWLSLPQPDFGGTLGPSAPHSARGGGNAAMGSLVLGDFTHKHGVEPTTRCMSTNDICKKKSADIVHVYI